MSLLQKKKQQSNKARFSIEYKCPEHLRGQCGQQLQDIANSLTPEELALIHKTVTNNIYKGIAFTNLRKHLS